MHRVRLVQTGRIEFSALGSVRKRCSAAVTTQKSDFGRRKDQERRMLARPQRHHNPAGARCPAQCHAGKAFAVAMLIGIGEVEAGMLAGVTISDDVDVEQRG